MLKKNRKGGIKSREEKSGGNEDQEMSLLRTTSEEGPLLKDLCIPSSVRVHVGDYLFLLITIGFTSAGHRGMLHSAPREPGGTGGAQPLCGMPGDVALAGSATRVLTEGIRPVENALCLIRSLIEPHITRWFIHSSADSYTHTRVRLFSPPHPTHHQRYCHLLRHRNSFKVRRIVKGGDTGVCSRRA